MIREYLKVCVAKFVLIFGTAFLIFLKFKKLISDIDKKKEIIILCIPTSGVKIIKQAKRRTEPRM